MKCDRLNLDAVLATATVRVLEHDGSMGMMALLFQENI